jgi:hypothetical protein
MSYVPIPQAENPAATELRVLLLAEIEDNTTKPDWKGHGVTIRWNQFSLTPQMKAAVNAIGQEHGCHTCLTRLEIDRDQPWVGDHFPPTELTLHARAALAELLGDPLFMSNTQLLFPQCQECSSRQAALVRLLNTMTTSKIMEWLKGSEEALLDVQMLTSGVSAVRKGHTCIGATGPRVSGLEGVRIQGIGSVHGCHSDPSHTSPCSIYHADHTWPQEFCTNYMEEVMKFLKIDDRRPAQQELRPQCPRCSGNQGGKLSNISKKALAFAQANNITFYK